MRGNSQSTHRPPKNPPQRPIKFGNITIMLRSKIGTLCISMKYRESHVTKNTQPMFVPI